LKIRENENSQKQIPCSIIDELKFYAYIGKLNFVKKKRGLKQVDTDYNKGLWNRKYEDIEFESIKGNYNKKDNQYSICAINGKLYKGNYEQNEKQYQKQFFDILDNYTDKPVVELGCGLGTNLFQLHHRNFKKLEGYDLSENAISLVKRYNTEKKYNIHFDTLNLIKSFPKGIIENKIVFTHSCLEQLKNYMPNVLKNIIDGKPKIVINFEVDYDSEPFMVKKYLDVRDYQNNLVRELHKLEKQEKIEIISIKKLPLALTPVNRMSAIIWKTKE
jgi:SAM-dependent methyltransferase